ncbi:hypothetical protein ACHAQA_005834 [Verticillium albo-atrum]
MPIKPSMATRLPLRSASDATRFTSTTPHASSKHPSPSATTSAAASAASRLSGNGPRKSGETPEERVRRLRAAHEAARKAQVSGFDKAVGGGRRFFDFAHRFTIAGLLGFTALAGLVSVYSVYDMVTYNRKRREDFAEAQKLMDADSLSAARIAFINGTATEDQIQLVEDANAQARETGVKLPPLLAPAPPTGASIALGAATEAPSPVLDALAREEELRALEARRGKTGGSWWPFSSSAAASDSTAGGEVVKAVREGKEAIRDSAHAAFEKEKEAQRQGGPLDKVGLEGEKKKGWW